MLDKVWYIASQFYHHEKEYIFFSELVLSCIHNKNASIIDVSCGTGFPVINLLQDGFKNIECSDAYLPNVSFLIDELNKLKLNSEVKHLKFKDLPTIKKDYELVFSIGTSITYCETWDEISNKINFSRSEIKNSVMGMISIVKQDGFLIIGISNLYNKDKNIDMIDFPEKIIDGVPYTMKWEINYDWDIRKKVWSSKIFTNGNVLYETKIESHLITAQELKDMCKNYFKNIEIVFNSEMSSEIYIVCKSKY